MADTTTKRAVQCEIDGNKIFLPTSADMVTDLPEFVDGKLATFNNTTLANQISALDNKYLAKTGKAANSAKADSCTTAVKATQDGDGRVIKTTYYTTDATVAQASADAQGANFVDNYAQKTGTYSSMHVGFADSSTTAVTADYASGQTGAKKTIAESYIRDISVNGTTFKYTYGSGAQSTTTLQDTTYGLATRVANGLMSADDKTNIDRLAYVTQLRENTAGFNADFNNIIDSGIYHVHGTNYWINRPDGLGGASAFLIAWNNHAGGSIQLCFVADRNALFYRNFFRVEDANHNISEGWTDWVKFSGTVVNTITSV